MPPCRFVARVAPASTAAEQDDPVAADFRALALDAFLVGVLVSLQAAFDVHLLPLAQVLGERLGLFAPDVDVVPLGPFLLLAGLVVPRFGGGEAEFRDGGTARRVAEFRITTKVADENHFVDGAHGTTILLLVGPSEIV